MSRSTANWLFGAYLLLVALLLGKPSPALSQGRADLICDLAGLLLILAGLFIRLISRQWKVAGRGQELIMTGPYAVVRNPMYVGSLLVGVGLCLIWGSLPFLIAYTVSFIVLHVLVVKGEERYLAGKWGDEYRSYCLDTPAWIPSAKRVAEGLRSGDLNGLASRAAILRESDTICLALALASLLDGLSDHIVQSSTTSESGLVLRAAFALAMGVVWVLSRAALRRARAAAR